MVLVLDPKMCPVSCFVLLSPNPQVWVGNERRCVKITAFIQRHVAYKIVEVAELVAVVPHFLRSATTRPVQLFVDVAFTRSVEPILLEHSAVIDTPPNAVM
jgi:hypothetical protein